MKRILLLVAVLIALPSNAFSIPLQNFLTQRVGYSLGDVDARSFDGAGFDLLGAVVSSGLTDGNFYQIAPITNDSDQLFNLVAEVANYTGENSLGFVDADAADVAGSFQSFISGSAPANGTVSLTTNSNNTVLALNSPDGIFYSPDSMNANNSAHFVALNIISDGIVNFSSLGISFNVRAGDVVVGIEDLFFTRSDFDYNDMVVVFREVPEPASMLLLGSGLLGLGKLRRKKASRA